MARAVPPSGAAPTSTSWLSAGEGALQRTAHLLTGTVYAAQDLVQNTLARLYRRWDRIRDLDDVDARRPPGAGRRVPYGVASAGAPR